MGEDIACRHLKSTGHEIIARNFRAEGGEIDIISLCEDTVFFSEVKTRKSGSMIPIEESITADKRVRIERAAKFFLGKNFDDDTNVKFLFIFLVLENNGAVKKIDILCDFL